MPHKWVFPGGRVERSDLRAPAASELSPDVEEAVRTLRRGRSQGRAPRALALAAVRETFEEAGLLLAAPLEKRDARPRPEGCWRAFADLGVGADLSALDFVGCAVTPASRPKRFDAAFFVAPAERLHDAQAAQRSRELDEVGWFTEEAVGALDLPAVTRTLAAEALARLADPGRPPVLLVSGRSRAPPAARRRAPER